MRPKLDKSANTMATHTVLITDVENMGEMMREYRLGQHSPTDKDRQGKSRTYADFDMDTQSQRVNII